MELKKVLLWVLIVLLLAVIFAFTFTKAKDLIDKSGKTSADIGMDAINDGLSGKTNGGVLDPQIKKETAEPTAPKLSDEVNTMYYQENSLGVTIYYVLKTEENGKTKTIYPNLFFRKTDNGLMLDGVANASLETKKGYNFDGVSLDVDFSTKPKLIADNWYSSWGLSLHEFQSIASITDTHCYYWKNYDHNRRFVGPSKKEQKSCAKVVGTAVGEIVEKYFTNIFGWGLILQSNTKDNQLQNFKRYTSYLWNCLPESKVSEHASTSAIADVTDLFAKMIPTELQKNYPVPDSKKVELGINYFRFYNVNKFIDVRYSYVGAPYKPMTKPDKTTVETETNYPQVTPPKVTRMLTTVKLVNSTGASLTGVDFATNPVTIDFKADNNTAQVIFDSVDDVITSQNVVLNVNTKYTYSITSSYLCFASFTGTITTSDKAQTLSFDYTYENGAVVAYLGLNAVGTIDFNSVNLKNTPVKITLSSGQTITWDKNENFDFKYSLLLPIGEIEYTILSDGLTFASTTGKFTIDAQNRIQLFNCGMSVEPDIVLSSGNDMVVSNANDMTLSIGVLNDNYNALFGEGSQYIVSVYLYDGETQYTLTKSREENMPYVSGSQPAGVILIYALPSNFVISPWGSDYHTYKLQVKTSNGSNVYLSNLLDYKRYYGDNATQYATYINTLQFNITL